LPESDCVFALSKGGIINYNDWLRFL
jgi:hypothetical protein